MSTIALAFVSGISFGLGCAFAFVLYAVARVRGKKTVQELNEETVKLLKERNEINERIATALEGVAK